MAFGPPEWLRRPQSVRKAVSGHRPAQSEDRRRARRNRADASHSQAECIDTFAQRGAGHAKALRSAHQIAVLVLEYALDHLALKSLEHRLLPFLLQTGVDKVQGVVEGERRGGGRLRRLAGDTILLK